jgi:hypothetical protein
MAAWATLAGCGAAEAAGLGRISIAEPLGVTWKGEWLDREVEIDTGGRTIAAGRLRLVGPEGSAVPVQFSREGRLLGDEETVSGKVKLSALLLATVPANKTVEFAVVEAATGTDHGWTPVTVHADGGLCRVGNGLYELELDASRPLPINAMRFGDVKGTLGTFSWPEGLKPVGVANEWVERGPARAILKRTFRFADPSRRYAMTLDFRAGDPWIGVVDEYALGRGTSIRLDLRALRPDKVYHHYAYNARTFNPGGDSEDSTLQPPQHPIATLGPIWRDIWYNGGPFAFIYRSGAECGLGLATVRGSRWRVPEGVSLESQDLFVHGDRQIEGQVWVEIPTDAGSRHWALVIGEPDLRKSMPRLIRSHADIPLNTVLTEWVLDWKSDAPVKRVGTFSYLGGCFNEHQKNPTTIPRSVKKMLRTLGPGPYKSRELAVLAYVFSDPDYWPGPDYKWRIGNPNFHTDMYPVPFLVALLMPDHPHAKDWLDFGVRNIRGQIATDSFPGGSWAESLSYSGAFFSVARYAKMAAEAGRVNLFRDMPRIREIATWFACLQTPVDPRYGCRQKAPIGDTSPGNHVDGLRTLGECYRGIDEKFAEQLARFPAPWPGALDLSSREFYGFGAALRGNAYDERHESFVAFKAGPARNHYQGDELSVYFASLGVPLLIDYACHYSPRPWHAAMHNRPDMNDLRPVAIAARRALAASAVADVFVADERTTEINHVPLEPHHAVKPGWEYPTTRLPAGRPWTMRRYAMLVKHDPKVSQIADYLVIRDEIDSPQPVWWNLHVLGREIRREGYRFDFPGQLDVDLAAHFLAPHVGDVQQRQWGWREGKSSSERRTLKGPEYEKAFFGAWIPRDFQPGTWGKGEHSGEMARWLRVKGQAGRTDWLVVLMPNLQGRPAPKVEKLSPTSARITLGQESEVVHLGSDGAHQAAVERGARLTVLLEAGAVRPWNELEFKPVPATVDKGGR